MRYFITGHTGFKGTWLTFLLKELGHEVFGYSHEIRPNSAFEISGAADILSGNTLGDIRDLGSLSESLKFAEPDIVVHLAAQPLVLRSYVNPLETFTTNVQGTQNLLQAVEEVPNVKVALVITTDKVYRDQGSTPYVESCPLGGHDPYSASKAMADILTQSWANISHSTKYLVARAGNVIGALDDSVDRLLPDIVRSFRSRNNLEIRNPKAVRPWQHVLDCLHGYVLYIESALENPTGTPEVLNFGPPPMHSRTVEDVVAVAQEVLGDLGTLLKESSSGKESQTLSLDSSKAEKVLGWKTTMSFEDAVTSSIVIGETDPASLIQRQCSRFLIGLR